MNWQPIETAPLDGTSILLWSSELDEPVIGRRSCEHTHLRQWWVDAWAPPDFNKPTHWMPLPAPPDAAQPVQLAEDALRKDAERYRWLRERIPGGAYRLMGVIYSDGGAGVDAAIDAAMKPAS